MSTPDTGNKAEPIEVHAIVGKILTLISESVSCSDEMLVAALKIAAITVEETRNAHFGAQLRAGIIQQNRPKI